MRKFYGKRQFAFSVRSNFENSCLGTKVGYSLTGNMLKLPSKEYWSIVLCPIFGKREITFEYSNSLMLIVSSTWVSLIATLCVGPELDIAPVNKGTLAAA